MWQPVENAEETKYAKERINPRSAKDADHLKEQDNLCKDMDEDCLDVPCKLTCWLHAPELGICPYLK